MTSKGKYTVNLILSVVIAMSILSGCSSESAYTTVLEAIESIDDIKRVETPADIELAGIKPQSYQLDNSELIRVYDFGTEKKRELAYEDFAQKQLILSSYGPLVYRTGGFLILYYSDAAAGTPTPKASQTSYGEQIENLLRQVKNG